MRSSVAEQWGKELAAGKQLSLHPQKAPASSSAWLHIMTVTYKILYQVKGHLFQIPKTFLRGE